MHCLFPRLLILDQVAVHLVVEDTIQFKVNGGEGLESISGEDFAEECLGPVVAWKT